MTYIDFHTHHLPTEPDVVAVVDGRDTWGLHPWRAGEGWPASVPDLSSRLAIGECGLDALRGPSMQAQLEVFRRQVRLSETLGKPLIVHCVKAIDLLLQVHRELCPSVPWLLHGFRGKPQQLRSLLAAGMYVGFGYRHNAESLRLCPLARLMPETDDDPLHPIREIYNNVALAQGISVPQLCTAMDENYHAFFKKEPPRG